MKKENIGKLFILICATLIGASLGILWLPSLWQFIHLNNELIDNSLTNGIIGSIVTFIFALIFSQYILNFINQIESTIENILSKKSPLYLITTSLGTVIGLLIGVLLSNVFHYINIPVISQVLPVVVILFFGYIGFKLGTKDSDYYKRILTSWGTKNNNSILTPQQKKLSNYKLLDTNTLIDGRIFDIVRIGFIEGTIVVPLFVVQELQHIADASDSLKRTKGRLGLDILNQIQSLSNVTIDILDKDFDHINEVDSKLVKLAQELNAVIVTNDFNLNKVCQIQQIPVLNINELANALKPNLLPGEITTVSIVKHGSERQQGIAYLNDGTMIVVEDGSQFINENIEVVITSALQTAAGRMIFAKPTIKH